MIVSNKREDSCNSIKNKANDTDNDDSDWEY